MTLSEDRRQRCTSYAMGKGGGGKLCNICKSAISYKKKRHKLFGSLKKRLATTNTRDTITIIELLREYNYYYYFFIIFINFFIVFLKYNCTRLYRRHDLFVPYSLCFCLCTQFLHLTFANATGGSYMAQHRTIDDERARLLR